MTGAVPPGRSVFETLLVRHSAACVFVVALVLFALGASQRDLWRTDEHRYTEVSREMTTAAGAWLVPHLNGRAYSSKPPGYFWLVALLHDPLGLGIDSAAKGVSALAAAFSVALTFALGRRLGSPWLGLVSASVLASTEMFLSLALRANLDALLTAFTTAALYAYWRSFEDARDGRAASGRWVLAGGLCAGLAVLVKGPVGLFIPALVIVAHRLMRRAGPASRGAWIAAAMLALAPALLWLVAATSQAGTAFARDLVIGNAIGHPLGAVGKQRPFWFYLKDLPNGLLPWSVGLPAALLVASRSSWRTGDAFLLAWLLAPLLALSLFPAKRHLYLLPLYPAAALLLGRWLTDAVSDRESRAVPRGLPTLSRLGRLLLGASGLVVGVSLWLGALGFVGGWTDRLLETWRPLELTEALRPVSWVGGLLAGILLVCSGLGLLVGRRGAWARAACIGLGLGTSLFLALVLHPIQSAGRSSAAFFRDVRAVIGDDPIAYYGGRRWDAHWLLERTDVPDLSLPQDQERFARLAESGRTRWLVSESDYLRARGWPDGFREVLRVERAFDQPLLLLRSSAPGRDP